MRDTVWARKRQKLVETDGTPKGAAQILEERGIRTQTLKLADMRIILANHDNFKTEKSALETMLILTKATQLFSSLNYTVSLTASRGLGVIARELFVVNVIILCNLYE